MQLKILQIYWTYFPNNLKYIILVSTILKIGGWREQQLFPPSPPHTNRNILNFKLLFPSVLPWLKVSVLLVQVRIQNNWQSSHANHTWMTLTWLHPIGFCTLREPHVINQNNNNNKKKSVFFFLNQINQCIAMDKQYHILFLPRNTCIVTKSLDSFCVYILLPWSLQLNFVNFSSSVVNTEIIT